MSGDHNMHCSANTGGPAYPTNNWEKMVPLSTGYHEGMTLRDYFAAKAMQGLLARTGHEKINAHSVLAQRVYQIADAMIEARDK